VTNGYGRDSTRNGHTSEQSGKADTSSRFEAMSQEREALRAEVEQLRKSLEDIQGKHNQEITSIKSRHAEELLKTQERHGQEVSAAQNQHTEEISTIRAELEDSQAAKEQAETQYQHLLGRINTIKASLGERLKADKQELDEAKEQIGELEAQNEALQKQIQTLETGAKRMEEESSETSKELSSLRNRHNLSQENWVHEREDMMNQIRHLKDEAEAAKDAMGDWEVLAMEEKRMREGLTERVADLEEQYSTQKESYEDAITERDTQSQAVVGLQRALQEVQDARKRELREMVESYEEQLQSLKKLVHESDTRANEADASKGALQTELNRLAPFEKEVKEKNLLIGKLRHEAIVLNDHLTKALRFLKKAKPEDNIDRSALLLSACETY
jgi:chromosome segregation ATPase